MMLLFRFLENCFFTVSILLGRNKKNRVRPLHSMDGTFDVRCGSRVRQCVALFIGVALFSMGFIVM